MRFAGLLLAGSLTWVGVARAEDFRILLSGAAVGAQADAPEYAPTLRAALARHPFFASRKLLIDDASESENRVSGQVRELARKLQSPTRYQAVVFLFSAARSLAPDYHASHSWFSSLAGALRDTRSALPGENCNLPGPTLNLLKLAKSRVEAAGGRFVILSDASSAFFSRNSFPFPARLLARDVFVDRDVIHLCMLHQGLDVISSSAIGSVFADRERTILGPNRILLTRRGMNFLAMLAALEIGSYFKAELPSPAREK